MDKFGPRPGDDAAEYWQAAYDAEKEYGDNLHATIAALQSEIARMREALTITEAALVRLDNLGPFKSVMREVRAAITIAHAALSAPDVTRREG